MDFIPIVPKSPDHIGDISFVITDYLDNAENTDSVSYSVQILQEDGSIYAVESGDLGPYLTAQQIEALVGFAAQMRVLAQGLIQS